MRKRGLDLCFAVESDQGLVGQWRLVRYFKGLLVQVIVDGNRTASCLAFDQMDGFVSGSRDEPRFEKLRLFQLVKFFEKRNENFLKHVRGQIAA